MSGSDREVKVNVGADTSKYSDAVESAVKSSQQLAASVTAVANVVASGQSAFLRAGQPVEALAAALLKAGISADQVNKTLGFTAAAANQLSNAAQAATTSAASFRSLAVPTEAAAAATARLEEAIARLMSGTSALPSATGAASGAIDRVSAAVTQSAAQIGADTEATQRLDAATRQILSTLSPAALAMMRSAAAATSTAQSLDAETAATTRLDAATRAALSGLSPATLAMLRLRDAATQTSSAVNASGVAAAEAASGMTSVSTATTTAASVSEAATTQMMGNSRQAAAMARLAARASFDAAVATASTAEPLQRLGENYANAAAQALRAGATSKEVAKSLNLPVEAVQRFAGALQAAMEAQRNANNAAGETKVVTEELAGSLQAAARLEEAVTKNLESLASATRAANAATKEAATSSDNFGSANQRAGEKVTSAGNKYYSAGQGVTALYHALIAAGDSAEATAKKLGVVNEQLDKSNTASKSSGLGMSGLTREFVVLGHEALSGNWTRIPGTLLVLSEYTGNARQAVVNFATSFGPLGTAAGIAAAAVVAGLGLMIERAYEAKRALDDVTAAAALMGRSTVDAANSAKAIRESLQDAGMGRADIDKVNAEIARTPGLTEESRRAFGALAPAMQAAYPGEPVDKYFKALMQAAAGGASAVKAYLQQIDGLNESNIKGLATAEAQNDRQAASAILLTHMRAVLDGYNSALAQRKKLLDDINVPGLDAMPITNQMLPRIRLPSSTLPEAQASDPETVRRAEETEKLLAPMREREALQRTINDLEEGIGKGGAEADLARQREALKIAQAKLITLRDAGDSTEAARQRGDLAELLAARAQAGGEAKRMALDEDRIRIEFWDKEAAKANQTEGQITHAREEASNARKRLAEREAQESGTYLQEIAQKARFAGEAATVAADKQHRTVKEITEAATRAELAIYDAASKDMERSQHEREQTAYQAASLHMRLIKEEAGGDAAAAKQALAVRLSALNTEQAEHRDNFEKVMQLEDQKIALLKAAGATETKQLNDELTRQANMRRQHTLEIIAEQERALSSSRGAHTAEISEYRSLLDEEVSERRMSKAQEMDALRTFSDQKHALDLDDLNSLLKTIDPQTEAYRKLYDDITKLKQQWLAQDRRLNAEATADLKRQWDAATAPISQAIDSQIGAMLRGTQTISQSVAGMAQNIVADYAKMGIKAATTWASSQLMQLAIGRSTEAAKNTITASGAAARAGITNAETASQNSGLIVQLGKWIATQLGMTSATATGAGAREAALSAEQIASIQATGAAARLSIAAAAAVAAAWAFADSAMLGPAGLAAAPAAATGAEASVMAWQGAVPSLDVGAWNVPKDMGANLHAGEMVVPANFASGLRGTINGSKGGDMNLNYSPTVNGGGTDANSLMRNQAGMIKSYLWHATRNGALRLPGR